MPLDLGIDIMIDNYSLIFLYSRKFNLSAEFDNNFEEHIDYYYINRNLRNNFDMLAISNIDFHLHIHIITLDNNLVKYNHSLSEIFDLIQPVAFGSS